jgi:hypothetical protein
MTHQLQTIRRREWTNKARQLFSIESQKAFQLQWKSVFFRCGSNPKGFFYIQCPKNKFYTKKKLTYQNPTLFFGWVQDTFGNLIDCISSG